MRSFAITTAVLVLSTAMARADTWTTVAPLSAEREGLGAVALPDGRVVAFGGAARRRLPHSHTHQ